MDPIVKDNISMLFSKKSNLRVVIATIIAFGMGIHCLDVRQIVRVGPPDDVESYIQETGRASAGRDGEESIAVLLLLKGARPFMDLYNYVKNSSICKRDALFSPFEGYQYNAQSPCLNKM